MSFDFQSIRAKFYLLFFIVEFSAQVPLTEEQQERANAEETVYESMSLSKRRKFRALEEWVKYLRVHE